MVAVVQLTLIRMEYVTTKILVLGATMLVAFAMVQVQSMPVAVLACLQGGVIAMETSRTPLVFVEGIVPLI